MPPSIPVHAVYGEALPDLQPPGPAPTQVSPLAPGSTPLERCANLAGLAMAAPAGTLERRYQLALGLQALRPGAILTAFAAKDKGGARLRKELEGFGCEVEEWAKHHRRICTCERPPTLVGVAEALREGGPRLVEGLGLWSQPGVFSWDRIDQGSAVLAQSLPRLTGRGADLGCGVGLLSRVVLTSPEVLALTLIDVDRRAIEAARRNVVDPRAAFRWADVTRVAPAPGDLDFVVMNPPFHDGGAEDRSLGQAFIRRAAEALRKDGVLWMVANRHLPYEEVLASLFTRVEPQAGQAGYKVLKAFR